MTSLDRTIKISPEAASEVGILAEITAGLATGGDLETLLQHFLEPVVRLAGATAGAVRVLSASGEQLQLISSLGLPAGTCGSDRAVDRHCGVCGAAADGLAVVWAADLRNCSARTVGPFFDQACQRLLAVPLQHRGRVLGVYNLFFAGPDEPTPAVMAMLQSVGELLGLALRNARLEEQQLRATLLQERQMMAAEVHDSLAQSLAFVKMRLPLLKDALLLHDDARALGYHEDVRQAVSQAHASVRGILTHFRSPMDPQGLVHALGVSAETFRRSSGAELDFINELPGLRLGADAEAQVFHIVQEALNNIARHAAASHARLHIGPVRGSSVEVSVEDDGTGLPATAAAGGAHYGLDIMQERARRIGGTLEIGPRQGGGTRVRLAFPVQGAEATWLAQAR